MRTFAQENIINIIYPCTIVLDRYRGTYSGALWTAWNLENYNLPEGVDGGDIECLNFWDEYSGIVGKGNSPHDAYLDLINKLVNKLMLD